MLAGRHEVEFVAVRPVTIDHDQQEDAECGHNRPDLPDCKPRSLHPTIFSELLGCLGARVYKHFGNGAVRGVDVALVEPDQIPDGVLEHSP